MQNFVVKKAKRYLSVVFGLALLVSVEAYASSPYLLEFSEIIKLHQDDRHEYLNAVAEALMFLEVEKGYTFDFSFLIPKAHAASDYRCVGGGVPVKGDQTRCGANSYAGFECKGADAGKEICNPFIFGVKKGSGKPFCYRNATTAYCFKKAKPGVNSSTDMVFNLDGAKEEYDKFVLEIDKICSGKVSVQESDYNREKACKLVARQTEINRKRELKGFRVEAEEAVDDGEPLEPVEDFSNWAKLAAATDLPIEEPAREDKPVRVVPASGALAAGQCVMTIAGQPTSCVTTTPGLKERSWQDVAKLACLYEGSNKPLCPTGDDIGFEGLIKRIEIVADEFDLDPRHLACKVLMESRFKRYNESGGILCSKVKKSRGACGIAQFMPDSAKYMAGKIKSKYGTQWKSYQERLPGKQISLSRFDATKITDGIESYGLFAMGAYVREIFGKQEKWKGYLENGGDPRQLLHVLISGYNAGHKKYNYWTNKVIDSGMTAKQVVAPNETQGYIEKFDQCMYQGSWNFAGKRPSNSRKVKCKIGLAEPICPVRRATDGGAIN